MSNLEFVGARRIVLLIAVLTATAKTLAQESRVEVEFSVKEDAAPIIVPVTIDDEKFHVLVDTGSTSSLFDIRLLKHMKGQLRDETAYFSRRTEVLPTYNGPDIVIGGLTLTTVHQVFCSRFEDEWFQLAGFKIDGIIGMNYLRSEVVEVDMDNHRLAFIKNFSETAVGNPIAINYFTSHPHVKCKVNDQELVLLIDTGCIGTAEIQEILMKPVVGEIEKENTGSRIREAYFARCPKLALGEFILHNPVVGQHPRTDMLGIYFFARFKTTFDFPGKKMYLKPGRLYSSIDRTDCDGVFFSKRDHGDGKRVDSVVIGSIAERQGVMPGDVIEEIDGKPIKELPRAVVYRRWSQRDNAEMKLQLRRGEASMTVVLPAEPKE